MRQISVFTLFLATLGTEIVAAKGDGTLQAPLTIPAGRPGPVTVNWGDFNGDGKLDLVVANGVASNEASGSPSILVLFQDPQNRQEWKPLSLRIGTSSVFVRGADMDNDGFDDIMVADNARSAFFVKSKGDGTFDVPVPITQANGARWIAIADFNKDGKLDFASSNFRASNLTVFLGDGAGKFTLSQTFAGSREHTIDSLDFDGDGNMDIVMGSGLPGITPYKGDGKGRFAPRPNVSNLGCIEYISEVGHYRFNRELEKLEYFLQGDFNKDGKGDLAVTCIDDGTAYAGVSLGTGAYRRALQAVAGGGTDATAIADLNRDGNADVAVVSAGSTNLWVHPGKGDGTFLPAIVFNPTGGAPVFLISQDLDRDGFFDVVSAEQQSFSVTVFWGKGGDRFLESGFGVTGFTGAKGLAIADLDRDGLLDFLLPRSDQTVVNVYHKPGLAPASRPTLAIATESKYSLVEAADLDGDEVPDLVGADLVGGKLLVALLDAAGKPRNQLALAAGISPSSLELGQLDDAAPLDVAVPCKGSNHVAIFLGQGGGAFPPEPKLLPTVEKPKGGALGKIDGDAHTDLVVISDTAIGLHFGKGAGEFDPPVVLLTDTAKLFTDLALADLNGDSILDVVVTDSRTVNVLIFKGKGNREFEPFVPVKTSGAPTGLVLADLNGDGQLDLTTSSAQGRSIALLLSKGAEGFAPPATYGMGFAPLGHRIVDLNADGALDVVGFMTSQTTILLGRPVDSGDGSFRRGDVSADGQLGINDPIQVLSRLFLGGEALRCEDAADADDDGTLGVNDPILILSRLFLGGAALPPPGPESCGQDPRPDELGCPAGCD